MFEKFTHYAHPKEYYFRDPDTGFDYRQPTMEQLLTHIRSYRAQNDLSEIDFLEATVENYLCQRPENIGGCEPVRNIKRGIFQTIKGGIALLHNLLYHDFVPQEKADERAAICVACPLNEFPDRGPFIKWADDIAEASVENRKSKLHESLGQCAGCTCLMRAKVFFKGKITLTADEKVAMWNGSKGTCWQIIEGKDGQ